MTINAQRGIKRTCQDESCAKRFYDLNRASIECPYCGASYVPVAVVIAAPRAVYSKRPQYKVQQVSDDIVAPVAAVEAADDDASDDLVVDEAAAETDAEPELGILEIDDGSDSDDVIVDPSLAKDDHA